jgi:hypothetical protein
MYASSLIFHHSSFGIRHLSFQRFVIAVYHLSFVICSLSFQPGFQPEKSYSSGVALKTDGHRFSFDNYRHFTRAIGIL